jgi:GDPmannose 4,6-dehydratase
VVLDEQEEGPLGNPRLLQYSVDGIFGSNGIPFNHESPRRGETFVTRKVTMGVAILEAGFAFSHILAEVGSRDWAVKERALLQGGRPLKYEEGQSSIVRRRAS